MKGKNSTVGPDIAKDSLSFVGLLVYAAATMVQSSFGIQQPQAVIFDFGGVLVDWNPWHLYQHYFENKEQFEQFYNESRFREWNERADKGEKFSHLFRELKEYAPQWVSKAELFPAQFLRSIGGLHEGTVEILQQLHLAKVPLFGLTNWSAETFPLARKKYDFFDLFKDIVVSGEEKLMKPDPRLYQLALQRWGVTPQDAFFIDDKEENVRAGESLGIRGIVYQNSEALRADLQKAGFSI